MKALLVTRCGCSRMMEMESPPPPSYMVPLHYSRSFGMDPGLQVDQIDAVHDRRKFVRVDTARGPDLVFAHGFPGGLLVYEEVL